MKKVDKNNKELDIDVDEIDIPKKNKFVLLKIISIMLFLFMITFAILYMVNPTIKKNTKDVLKKTPIISNLFKPNNKNIEEDKRKETLADYYLSLDESRVVDKLDLLKKEDKKLYNDIIQKMKQKDLYTTNEIISTIENRNGKKDVLDKEIDNMNEEISNETQTSSGYYEKLNLPNSVKALQDDIINLNIDIKEASSIIENMKPENSAKILYYLDTNMASSIRDNLSKTYVKDLDKATFNYEDYLQSMKDEAVIYSNKKPDESAALLENRDNFNENDLSFIFLNMDYLQVARILSEFEDKDYLNTVLQNIRNNEYLFGFSDVDNNFSNDINNSLKVLALYQNDIALLRKSYEKMTAEEIATLVNEMTTNAPKFKQYTVDSGKSFTISEEEMMIDILKGMKPKFLSQVISNLSQQKGAEISRKIGLPTIKP